MIKRKNLKSIKNTFDFIHSVYVFFSFRKIQFSSFFEIDERETITDSF